MKVYKRDKYMRANSKLAHIHLLGKSPVVEIETAATATTNHNPNNPNNNQRRYQPPPLILAESGHIIEFLCGYYGQWLIPLRYPPGRPGEIGAESESWLRYFHLLHYAEGSFMPLNLAAILTQGKPSSFRSFLFRRFCWPGYLTRSTAS